MLALILNSGLVEDYNVSTWRDDPKLGRTACCWFKRKGISERIVREFSHAEAKQAGYLSRDTYRNHLDTMLMWRAIGRAVTPGFSDVLKGLIAMEEALDWPPENERNRELPSIVEPPKDVTALPEVSREPGDDNVLGLNLPHPDELEAAFQESIATKADPEATERAFVYFHERGVGEAKVLDWLGRRTRRDMVPEDLQRLRDVVRQTRGDHEAVGKVFFGGGLET